MSKKVINPGSFVICTLRSSLSADDAGRDVPGNRESFPIRQGCETEVFALAEHRPGRNAEKRSKTGMLMRLYIKYYRDR